MPNYEIYPRLRADKFTYKKRGYPIWIRFSCKGEKPCYIDSGVVVDEQYHWNDEIKMIIGGPYAKQRNDKLDLVLEAAKQRVIKAELKEENLKKSFKGKVLKDFEAYIKKHGGDNVGGAITQIKGAFGVVPSIEAVTVSWLDALLEYMEENELSQNSKKAYFVVLSKVCKKAVKDGYLSKSPIGEGLFEIPKKGVTNPKYLVEDEIDTLLRCFYNNTVLDDEQYRILVYAMLGAFTGLRFSDWEQFRIEEHVRGNFIDIIPVKTRETGTRVIQEIEPGTVLEDVINKIKLVGPLNIEYHKVSYELLKIQKILGIKTRLTTHIFRHSYGYRCAATETPKAVAAALMGISDPDVIEVYYHLTGEHVRQQSKRLNMVKQQGPD